MENIQNNNQLFSIIKGVLLAFAFTIISLIIFAILLVYTNLSEELIKPVIITLTGISILIGSSIGSKKIKKNGLVNGCLIGIIYILIIYIISSILSSNFSINSTSLVMMGVGLICGILGRNNWSKCIIFIRYLLICKIATKKVAIFVYMTNLFKIVKTINDKKWKKFPKNYCKFLYNIL